MDRLVTVELKELQIEFRPSQRCTSRSFRVTNVMHTMSVAVHLSTTRPSVFSILPSNSPTAVTLLPPLSSASFSLSLPPSPFPPPLPFSDALLVRSALLPTGRADSAALHRLFSSPGVRLFRDASLPIVLTGRHALDSLLRSPPSETLETAFLISKATASCSSTDLAVLLRRAAAGARPRIVSALLCAGADPNLPASDGKTPISLAVSSGSVDTVAALLAAGANINPALVHLAAGSGHAGIVSLLAGIVPRRIGWGDAVDHAGRSPLHEAAAGGHLETAMVCVTDGGADPDRADCDGWTPLHSAAAAGPPAELVEYLISASAFDGRRSLTRVGRKTPFDLAVEGGHEHLYDLLELDGDDLLQAARAGEVRGLREGCRSRRVDRRDQNGWTALHRAAFKGKAEAVKELVEQGGARMDVVEDAGYTPLHCAVEAGHGSVALWLVAMGAATAGLKGMKKTEELTARLEASCVVVDVRRVVSSLYEDNNSNNKVIEA